MPNDWNEPWYYAEQFCSFRHTIKIENREWVRGEYDHLIIKTYEHRPTQRAFYTRCRGCHTLSGSLPKTVFESWAANDPYGTVNEHDGHPRYSVRTEDGENRPMECGSKTCDRTDVDLHHYAPKAVFGWEDMSNWPVLPLCKHHHEYWHKMMLGFDPYQTEQDGGW